ncbi:MAG TPA: FkbM family methyltransferase [Opitutaceae bacterium]
MNPRLRRLLSKTVGLLPVTVRGGAAKGARWTLYPWTSYWRGTHETAVCDAFAALGNGDIRGWSCWDLGAHFGLYSVALAMRVGPGGQVAAFEPNPDSFARLERHRRMNHLDWMKTYQVAASDRSGCADLLAGDEPDSTSTHLAYDDEAQNRDTSAIAVRTIRLDELVKSGELRPPHFVKVDVEGHGHKAVEGMSASISSSRPLMIIGFHSKAEVDGVLGVLGPLHYRWAPIVPAPNPRDMIGGDYLFTP